MTRSRWLAGCTLAAVVSAQPVRAQPPATIDIEAAIRLAPAHHPVAEEDAATVRAADATVDVERARYWPELRVFAELDRSTSNTVAGGLFSVATLPVVAGQSGRSLAPGDFVTAVGATASWDALGFARWNASIDQARLALRAAHADARARALALSYAAADSLIAVVAADEAVKAANAGVDRAQVFVPIVKAAVDQSLRPGADLARAQAELAVATTALIRAETAAGVARALLAKALGMGERTFEVRAGGLLVLPPTSPPIASSHSDPRIAAEQARIEASQARERAIKTGSLPTLDLVAAAWGRGGGAEMTATAAGLVPDVPNWALGVVLTWPVFASQTVGPRARVEEALTARDRAHEREIKDDIASDVAQARAILDGAYRAVANTPVALKAAREAEQQATARYRAQLATADDVAQAERLLEQAEIDDALARLGVWRAILLGAYAGGDLSSFLRLYHQAGG